MLLRNRFWQCRTPYRKQSENNPKTLFIGSEVYMSGIGSLLSYINENKVKNIRIFSDDIRILLDQKCSETFNLINILCPDPWPKERHHKRRLINDDFLNMIQGFIKIDATYLYFYRLGKLC